MVERIMGKDCFPICNTTPRFRPKPSNTTADCKIFLEVNVNPTFNRLLSLTRGTNIIPINKAKTAPPTRGKCCPNHWLTKAIPRQIPIPGMYLPIVTFMYCLLCILPYYTPFSTCGHRFTRKILHDKNHIEFFTVYFALPFLNQSTRPRPSPTTPKMVKKRPACSPVAGRRAFFLALAAGGVGSSVVVGVGRF